MAEEEVVAAGDVVRDAAAAAGFVVVTTGAAGADPHATGVTVIALADINGLTERIRS